MKNPNLFLIGSVGLILLAVALVAILDRTSPSGTGNDVRARATSKQVLTVLGTVSSVNESKGTINVDNVQFSDTNRSGAVQNLGSWTITPPMGFNFASVSTGSQVTIGVVPETFQVSTKTLTAVSISPAK